MTQEEPQTDTLSALDAPTRCLVRLAAVIGAGTERQMRALLVEARTLPREWVEEVILQSYLFAGFPRTLNAAREWRRISGTSAPLADDDADATTPGMALHWRERGAETCAAVYGEPQPTASGGLVEQEGGKMSFTKRLGAPLAVEPRKLLW